MQIDDIWPELVDLVLGVVSHVPGETLNDKTGLLANVFGIAGFILSVSIVVGRYVKGRGKGRPATLGDLDRLGASLVASIQDRIVDQLAAKQLAQLAGAAWLPLEQRTEAQDQLRRGVAAAVQSITSDDSEDGRSAASALIKGDLAAAESYFESKVASTGADGRSAYAAAEALHMKAALQSLHDPISAVEACLRAIKMNPDDPLGWSRLGHLYLRMGKLSEAQAAFQKAVSL